MKPFDKNERLPAVNYYHKALILDVAAVLDPSLPNCSSRITILPFCVFFVPKNRHTELRSLFVIMNHSGKSLSRGRLTLYIHIKILEPVRGFRISGIFWGQWPSGLRRCSNNQKAPGPNPSSRSTEPRDPTPPQSPQRPPGQKCKTQ